MYTAIRMDDITPDMDLEKFNQIKNILDTYQIRPLIGVVPFNRDDNLHCNEDMKDFGGFLKEREAAGWTIALHGYEHVYTTSKGGLFPLNHFSEYGGVPYEKQLSMLQSGKQQLKLWGIDTDIFMAPGHTYDRNTLRALKQSGFCKVTDGFGTVPYIRRGLTFYPITKKKSECLKDKKGYSTLVLHANMMNGQEIESFHKMIREHADRFISYDEYLKIPAVYRNIFGHIREYLLATAKHYVVCLRSHL